MRLPRVEGVIERRLLVNWRVDPEAMARILPAPFRPKLANGWAMAGICLIRLGRLRPSFLPIDCGLRSENAAHRVAVTWDEDGAEREGVYIERRDTDSCLEALGGGRIFPGVHNRATFDVKESGDRVELRLASTDGAIEVEVTGRATADLPGTSVFRSLDEASTLFRGGALGWSATPDAGRFHGLELATRTWDVEAFAVDRARSSWIDAPRFPPGSAHFDCALLMRGIEHEWVAHDDLCCARPATAPR
jgi:uncharacterized protein YqjF (DUF2071 family)